MKSKSIPAIVLMIYGLLASLGPQTLFKVCENSTVPMKCTYASSAEIGIGLVTVLLGVLYLLSKTRHERQLLSAAGIGMAALTAAVPAFLIGGCKNPTMPCVMLSYPILYILSGVAATFLLFNIFALNKTERKVQGSR